MVDHGPDCVIVLHTGTGLTRDGSHDSFDLPYIKMRIDKEDDDNTKSFSHSPPTIEARLLKTLLVFLPS